MLLSNLIEKMSYIELVNAESLLDEVSGVSYNSKKVNSGDIFICLSGEHVDGHEFADEALLNGAVACVAERRLNNDYPQIIVSSTQEALAQISNIFYNNPSSKLNVIGVTGTNGKTTVTHLIQKLFEAFEEKCVMIGTLGYKFRSSESYHSPNGHTTPQAPELQRLMYYANERCHNNVVMEVSSHSIVQHRVSHIDFNGIIFTNLTQDHLDYHVTMENYFIAKASVFEDLVAGDFAIINADDEYAPRLLKMISPSVKVITYGIKNNADIQAKNIEFNTIGTNFTCVVGEKEYNALISMNGMFSVYNILAALATAQAHDFDIQKSILALGNISGVAGRFEVVCTKPMVIVDYAHTPDGLENVLKTAREIVPQDGKLFCLFGCGGDRDATKRPKMGAIAEKYADKVIITSDNPRSENPQQIITDILAGIEKVNDVIVEPDRELAIKEAYRIANAHDVVIIAGKGHEDYQILSTGTIHFDDREKVREIFLGVNG